MKNFWRSHAWALCGLGLLLGSGLRAEESDTRRGIECTERYGKEGSAWVFFPCNNKTEITGADFPSFHIFPEFPASNYAVDKDSVFFRGKKMPGVDPTGFVVLWDTGPQVAKSPSAVYVDGKPLENADPKTFEVLKPPPLPPPLSNLKYQSGYWRDAQHVWRWGKLAAEIDSATLELLPGRRARDKYGEYDDYGHKVDPLPPAPPEEPCPDTMEKLLAAKAARQEEMDKKCQAPHCHRNSRLGRWYVNCQRKIQETEKEGWNFGFQPGIRKSTGALFEYLRDWFRQ